MDVIVLKYVQLVCITIFMSNNANCAQLMSQTEEMNTLKVVACAANCLSANLKYNITKCYQQCANQSSDSLANVTDGNLQEPTDATFHLYCRDSNRLLIQVDKSDDDGHVENEKFIYVLVIQETKISFVDRFVYISDEPIIELHDLKPSESYNISATIVSSSYVHHFLGTQVFTTLLPDFTPQNVTDIELINFEPIEGDPEHVNALVHWEPAIDQTCIYDLFFHDPDTDVRPISVIAKEDRDLYYHEYKKLKVSTVYSVAVRGINVDVNKKSSDIWHPFTTPSCYALHKDTSQCGPEPIRNLLGHIQHVSNQEFTLSVSWNETEFKPEFYTLEVRDVDPIRNSNGSFKMYKFQIDQNETSTVIKYLEFEGNQAMVALESHRNNITVDYHILVVVPHPKTPHKPISISLFLFMFTVVIAVMCFVVLLCQSQISKMTIANKRKQLDNMDLDLIKTITNHSMLEVIADLTRDVTMEIERENITLLDKLGEGAFGFVKKADLVKDGSKYLVAVKMLKDKANIEDIKQFHQEISVMKSVGRHPNIVSIIGHCTSNIEELMLLTEFCDAGSLFDLLRSEFTKQLKFYEKKMAFAPAMSCHKYPDNLQNFDNVDVKETSSYKNFECSSRLFAVNQMYDELMNNNNINHINNNNVINNEIEMHQQRQAIDMTATNALYLELSDNDSKQVIIEMSEPEDPNRFLTGNNLISFAKQVSDGMEFLAQKKVVHRDLAARNILVCSDRTAKIADFGLSRDIYTDNIYTKKGSGKLPIKWLAIESMTHQVYTSKSDVWSFGILLYEIVMLGMQPYPSIDVKQLVNVLNTGYRMEKPNHCHPSLYDLMMSCWHANPTDRPTFQDISDKLSHFLKLENTWDERFIDLQKLYDKCTSEMNYLKPIA